MLGNSDVDWDLQDMEKWTVEELTMMLDPTGENRCVDYQLKIMTRRLEEQKDRLTGSQGLENSLKK